MQHEAHEYGANVNDDGIHSGGPFWIDVSLKMRVEDLRKVIRVGFWLSAPSIRTYMEL